MGVKLYVGNLPYTTTEEDLRTLFAQAGEVVSVSLIKDNYSGRSKGFAFVEMGTQSEAEDSISKFNGFSFNTRELKVSIARPREERPSQGFGGYRDQKGGGSRDRNRRGGTRRY